MFKHLKSFTKYELETYNFDIIISRLLLEESDEEEGDLCRICQMGEESASNPLIQPCHCTGSLQYVHQECIKRWLCSKIHSGKQTPHASVQPSVERHL